MSRFLLSAIIGGMFLAIAPLTAQVAGEETVRYGFAEVDITPAVDSSQPVWIAGYGHGRRATGVHDPLMARCTVLEHAGQKIALVAVDLVGLQYPEVQRIREQLSTYRYVLVASTHNHEGPDVIGIWGPTPVQRGVHDSYLKLVMERVVGAVKRAEESLTAARVRFGTAEVADQLLQDNREPFVKDRVIRVLRFDDATSAKPLGMLVSYSCHPESLGPRNTLLTADFPYYTIRKLRQDLGCPVLYFSGAVGGLMTNPGDPIRAANGQEYRDGTFEYAEAYGEEIAKTIATAFQEAQPVQATPLAASTEVVAIPVQNQLYRAAREMGVLNRPAVPWKATSSDPAENSGGIAMQTEVACVKIGEVRIAGIPGEIYPELVYGKVQEPVDPAADFPAAPLEPAVAKTLADSKWLLIGLANDEVGYIIPKRQWDAAAPFCYGRSKTQYGEINSCGPDVARILLEGLQRAAGK